MKKQIEVCDLCAMDGNENEPAVAEYTADDDEEYAVCAEHLEDVKASGYKYTMLDLDNE